MTIEQKVAAHYRHGSLLTTILDSLAASGKDTEKLSTADLPSIDEFHLGWRGATAELAKALAFPEGADVIDLGSGLGGPARYFAEAHRCNVTGVDLTDEFVEVATELTRRCGLSNRARFLQGSALDLPFDDHSFDGATLIHVGMNIHDKATLFTQARRVLARGAAFGVYEVMRVGDGEIPYPTPWAMTAETSFIETPATYRTLLEETGFGIESERNLASFVLALFAKMREASAGNGSPLPNLPALLGPNAKQRFGNLFKALEQGLLAPVMIVARAQ